MKIYTITLSPAYDIHAYTDNLKPFCEHLADIRVRDIGGKGINISRALKNVGTKNTAIVVLGNDNCGEFLTTLKKEEIDCILFKRDGRIRENITLHSDGDKETRISFKGFSADENLLSQISDSIEVDEDTVITFTGRVPDGISVKCCVNFLSRLKQQGAKIVLDSKSFSFEDICSLKPWLIKPNEEEINQYLGVVVKDLEAAADAADSFYSRGVENVMISLGKQGAVLLCEQGIFSAVAPEINAVSTIGAGDSSIAGFIAAFAARLSPAEHLRSAVAFGSAACLKEGSQPPEKACIDSIIKDITVTKNHTR